MKTKTKPSNPKNRVQFEVDPEVQRKFRLIVADSGTNFSVEFERLVNEEFARSSFAPLLTSVSA